MSDRELREKAKAVVEDWRDRVSLGYDGTWPQMDALAQLFEASGRGLLAEDHSEIRVVPQSARDVWSGREAVVRCVRCGQPIKLREKARRTELGWEHARKAGC